MLCASPSVCTTSLPFAACSVVLTPPPAWPFKTISVRHAPSKRIDLGPCVSVQLATAAPRRHSIGAQGSRSPQPTSLAESVRHLGSLSLAGLHTMTRDLFLPHGLNAIDPFAKASSTPAWSVNQWIDFRYPGSTWLPDTAVPHVPHQGRFRRET